MNTAFISVQGLTRRFADPSGRGELTVFEDLWFNVAEGEFACVVGHSGCGKSTILNILAGLDAPTEGHIIAAGKHVLGPSLDRAVYNIAYLVPNVDEAVAALKTKGVKTRVEPRSIGTVRYAFVQDPNGVEIELIHLQR